MTRAAAWRPVPVLAVLAFAALPMNAFACRCAAENIAAGYPRVHAVITGMVEHVTPIGPAGAGSMAEVKVGAAWKHAMPASIQVATETSCAFGWSAGQAYVLAIFREEGGRFSTARCLGNQLLPAEKTLAWLRRHGRPERVDGQ